MTVIQNLYSRISKAEGKMHQAKHGDVMEVLKLACIEMALDDSLAPAMKDHGKKLLKKLKGMK